MADDHLRRTLRLIAETMGVFIALAAAALAALALLPASAAWTAVAMLAIGQGLWLDRLYTVAHEAVHRKLFPAQQRLNDRVGAALMLPIAAPFTIYRRIHGFHHGGNRRDPETAALDHFRTDGAVTDAAQRRCRALWLFYVFGGGFFLHSLVTILIFLVVPTRRAERISPVFRAWPRRLRMRAWAELAAGIGFHAAVWAALGGTAWLALLGLPLLVFAWFWSAKLYIYHYRAAVGPDVRANARSLPRQPFFSWLLLNFNEHETHHRDPSIPWYALPARSVAQLRAGEPATLWAAIARQRAGPVLWSRE